MLVARSSETTNITLLSVITGMYKILHFKMAMSLNTYMFRIVSRHTST